LLSPPEDYRFQVAFHRLPSSDLPDWKVGGIADVHALLADLYAKQWEKLVPEGEQCHCYVRVFEERVIEIDVKAATDEMAVAQAVALVRAGIGKDHVRIQQVDVLRFTSANRGSAEFRLKVTSDRLEEIRNIALSQIGNYVAGPG
jgi:hypothetical protein